MFDAYSPAEKIFTTGEFGAAPRGSRLLLGPFYIGVALCLATLVVTFFNELSFYAAQPGAPLSAMAVPLTVTLADLAVSANLLLVALASAYVDLGPRWRSGRRSGAATFLGTRRVRRLKAMLTSCAAMIFVLHVAKFVTGIGVAETVAIYGDEALLALLGQRVAFVVSGVLLILVSDDNPPEPAPANP